MDELQEIDVERIMERIRENIRRKRSVGEGFSPPVDRAGGTPASTPSQIGLGGTPPLQTGGQITADLASLHSGYDVYHIHFTSHRRILGPFVVFVKKVLRKLLTPILERQVAYNAANARVITYLKEQIDGLGQQQAQFSSLKEQVDALREQQAQFSSLKEQVDALREQQAQALQVMRERISRAERKLNRILYFLTDGQEVGEGFMPSHRAEGTAARVELKKVPRQALEADFDYFGFEERFRGSEEEIKERQRIYVEYFKGQENVLDIGCGRGEFLELLKEAGIQAKGVDLDLDMVLYCRDKGLDVVKEDAFAYLESLPDASLGGIFAAQVIEHLESNRIIQLVKLCHRKLRPGGVLILETPNPQCLMVFAQCFYMDFTHTWPIHPEALKFLLGSQGFRDVELKFTSPVDPSLRIPLLTDPSLLGPEGERFNRSIAYLNELLYGYQDYAVIARKE